MKKLLAIFTLLGLLTLGSCGSPDGSKIEMDYAETQCADAWMTGSGSDESVVLKAVNEYFDDLGVQLSDVKLVDHGDIITCAACDCLSNRTISLKVDQSHLTTMEAEGFVAN